MDLPPHSMLEQGKIPMVSNNKSAMSILESHGLTQHKNAARRPGLTSIQRQLMQDASHVGVGPPKGFSVAAADCSPSRHASKKSR